MSVLEFLFDKYLIQIPSRCWSKSRFQTPTMYDIMFNNMCETFNGVIVGPRQKPIITIIEEIRIYLREMLFANREKIAIFE